MSPMAAQNEGSLPLAEPSRWPKGLLWLTLVLAIAAPLAMYSGRVPGLGEFDYQIYYRLLFYNDFTNSLAMLGAFLFALAVRPVRQLALQLADSITRHPARACICALVVLAIASRVVYQGFPLAMDEYAPLLQARIFADGSLAATYPTELLDRMVVPGFQGVFILVNHETGQAASAYWPGLALLMTPFAWFGGEWLLNPLLAAAGLWLIGDLAKQASGHERARGFAILAALACPQYTINAISFYAMTGLLTLHLLYLWMILRRTPHMAFLAGFVGSMALVLHNPVPHALIALPVFVWLLARRDGRAQLVPLVAGYLPLAIMLGLGWPMLIGDMGLRHSGVASEAHGFISSWMQKLGDLFVMPTMGLVRVRAYAAWKTIIWAGPAFLVLALITKPTHAIQRLMLAGLLLSFAFYFFFPYDQGHGWGYRYIHPAWGLVPVTAGIVFASLDRERKNLMAAALCAGLLATPVFMYTTYRSITTSIAQQPAIPDEGRFLVFLNNHPSHYTVDLVRNYPDEQGRVVRLFSDGKDNDKALALSFAPGSALVSEDARGSVWRAPVALQTRAAAEAENSK